jgi:biofilm protein TabA
MIYDRLEHAMAYAGGHRRLQEALRFLQNVRLSALAPGKNAVDGDELYINCMTYATDEAQNRIWEAHRQYIDIHCVLEGTETMHLSGIGGMQVSKPYDQASDAELFTGAEEISVALKPGMFLVCFPQDVHKTGVWNGSRQEVRKVVFKVRLEPERADA